MNDAAFGPNWSHWINHADVELFQAIELSVGIEPGTVDRFYNERNLRYEFELEAAADDVQARLKIARSHIAAGTLAIDVRRTATDEFPYTSDPLPYVKLAAFREWGESLPSPFTFPDEFPRAPRPAPAMPAPIVTRWPWGDHETKLLRKLAEAASRFWKLYDPEDPTTAPTNQAVVDWLKQQDVAERNAQVMATILRADGLPTGPRA